jgi:hypothetical protein
MIYLVVLALSLGMAGIEAVSYLGFILKHTGISPYAVYLASVVAIHYYAPHQYKILCKLLSVTGIILLVVLFVLSFAEGANYPNYVYSHTHINLVSFQLLTVFVATHAVMLSIHKMKIMRKIGLALLAGLLAVAGVSGLGRTSAFVVTSVAQVVNNPFLTYEQKMTNTYPGLYPAMREVVRLTPPSATILIPPQANPWEFEGNGAIVTNFIYPRRVKNLGLSSDVPRLEGQVYVLIARGSWPNLISSTQYGWPKITIPAKRIWEFDISQQKSIEYSKDYDPKSDSWDWGLIEVSYD